MKRTILFLTYLFLSPYIFAQLGSDCDNAHVVDALPFIQTGLTTEFNPDTYNSSDACFSSYMEGNDYVFKYTPDNDIVVTFSLRNADYLVGLFVLDGCPDNIATSCMATGTMIDGIVEIKHVELLQGITYYMIVSTREFAGMFQFTPFDIEIVASHSIDARIVRMYPVSNCQLSSSEGVTVLFKNFGYDTIFNIQLGVQVNNDPPIIEDFPDILPPSMSTYHGFFPTFDFSQVDGDYLLKFWTAAEGETNPSNDTTYYWINRSHEVSAFPYFEDFDTSDGGWFHERYHGSLSLSSWEYGEPNASIINYASSGSGAWATNLTGTTNYMEKSYIQSPCFDFTNLTAPVIELDLWYETAAYDYFFICTSTDNGDSWDTLGYHNSGYNWYNTLVETTYDGWNGSSGGYIKARHTLDGLGGMPNVSIRVFYVAATQQVGEGVAVDNIKIYERPDHDLGVVEIVDIGNSCSYSGLQTVSVKLTNFGLIKKTGFDISYSVNDVPAFTETFSDTIYFEDTLNFTFAGQFDKSGFQEYHISSKTNLVNDQDSTNDETYSTIINFEEKTVPLTEDFENNNGGWYSIGANSSWQHGVPTDSVINFAPSGSNIWATNLSGQHTIKELSNLTSPCYDFSNAVMPKVNMNVRWQLQPTSYVQMLASTDGGVTWNAVLADAASNWYNSGVSWNGTSNGWVEVSTGLEDFVGEPQVQFMFNFDGRLPDAGFAIDDFSICNKALASFDYSSNGTTLSFTSNSQNADSYLWIFGDDSTSTSQNPDHTYESEDSIMVSLIVYNDCFTDTVSQFVHPNSIEELSFDHFINMFPNPADNEIYFRFKEAGTKPVIKLYDISGQLIIEKNTIDIHNNIIEKMSLAGLAKGVYLIRVVTDSYCVSQKLIVK